MTPLIFFVGMLLLFWVLIIQPQRKRKQQQARLLADLTVDNDVITTGGMYGTIREVAGDHVVLEIAPGTRVRVAKSAVAGRIEPAPNETEPAETPLT